MTLRAQRLRLPWLLALPFLYLAQPTPKTLLFGFLITLPGLCLRGVSSGYIHKDQVLAVHGPFALLRHPLYLGSFFVGLGLVLGGGAPALLPVYLLLFAWLYFRAARREEEELEARFGQEFADYRKRVPALLPAFLPALLPVPFPMAWAGKNPSGTAVHDEGAGTGSATGPAAGPAAGPSDGSRCGFQLRFFVMNRGWEAPLGTLGGFGLLWGKMALFI